MAQIFPEWTNRIPANMAVVVVFAILGGIGFIWYFFSPEFTDVGFKPVQPVIDRFVVSSWHRVRPPVGQRRAPYHRGGTRNGDGDAERPPAGAGGVTRWTGGWR